jgi:hypothetical protein
MTILELIQATCKEKGVDVKYAERIQKIFKIEKEDGIGGYVDLFKADVLPAIENAAQADAEAAKKAVEEYEKKHNIKDGKTIEREPDPDLSKLSPEMKAILESQSKQISELTGLVTKVVTGQSESQKLALVREKLKGKISEEFINDYIGQVKLDAEDVDAEVSRVVKSFTDMQQKFINKAVADGNYQPSSGTGGINSDKDIDTYIEQKNKDVQDSSFAGVKL